MRSQGARHLNALLVCGCIFFAFAALSQQPWPDLTVLTNYSNPHGSTCSIDGTAQPGSEKAKSNQLKNRFQPPPQGFVPVQLADMLQLSPGPNQPAPRSGEVRNNQAISIAGYVRKVDYGGSSFGESCNCGTKVKPLCDAHIELV